MPIFWCLKCQKWCLSFMKLAPEFQIFENWTFLFLNAALVQYLKVCHSNGLLDHLNKISKWMTSCFSF